LKKELKRMELMGMKLTCRRKTLLSKVTKLLHPYRTGIYGYGISMDIHAKSVDMDMDGKFHIHGNPVNFSLICDSCLCL